MLREYRETGKLQYNFGKKQAKSPSRALAQRQADASSKANLNDGSISNYGSNNSAIKEKSELHKYLNSLDIEDLEMISKERKSSKNNPGGPIIYG